MFRFANSLGELRAALWFGGMVSFVRRGEFSSNIQVTLMFDFGNLKLKSWSHDIR